MNRFWAKVEKSEQCWVWTAYRNRNGYGCFRVQNGTILAHRWAWEATNGIVEPGILVLHKCDNPACVRIEHLYLGSHADNSRDRDERHRAADHRGMANGRAKLSDDDVIEIRAKETLPLRTVASMYGVSQFVIYGIRKGLLWKHVGHQATTP